MNKTICIVENVRFFFFFFFFFFFLKKEKKEERVHKQKDENNDGLCEATGIYQKCLSNVHTEFLANDGNFLSLIKVLHHFKG